MTAAKTNRHRPHLLLFGLLLLCVAVGLSGGESSNRANLTILHTNDLHAQLQPDASGRGGVANVAAYVEKVRAEKDNVLFLDAGDMTQGSPVSTVFKGKPLFEIMNVMGYDAAVFGNHEFDEGSNLAFDYCRIADFPIVSANAFLNGEPVGDAPYTIREFGELRVAVLGITAEDYVPEELEFRSPEETLAKYLPQIDSNLDIIVVLTHLGFERDRALAAKFQDVDIIIGGHSHVALPEGHMEGEVLVAQAGARGRFVGRIDMVVNTETGKTVSRESRLINIPVSGLPSHGPTENIVQKWESKLPDNLELTIGHLPVRIGISELKRHIERIWRETYHTDFAHQNLGATRASLPKGNLLEQHIWESMPFSNTLAILEMTHEEVLGTIPGATFTDEKDLYTLVTNSYAAGYIIRAHKLPETRIRRVNESWRDPIINYIKKHGTILPSR